MDELAAQVNSVIEGIRDDLKRLNYELTAVIPKELEKARSYGDLSENFEYHSTKERQAFVQMRVSQLNRRLSDLRDLPLQNLPRETVGLFSHVFLEDDEGEVYDYKLVLPEMVEKDSCSISIGAPRAKALLGKAPGDRVRLPSEGGGIEADILRFINPWGEEID
ncbi:MAG: GreA/GreB family elongation factor [Nitrospinae bacterium]|nr:GreA/GreB family elongation factor [Nitrospinota bacterium]